MDEAKIATWHKAPASSPAGMEETEDVIDIWKGKEEKGTRFLKGFWMPGETELRQPHICG